MPCECLGILGHAVMTDGLSIKQSHHALLVASHACGPSRGNRPSVLFAIDQRGSLFA